MQTRMCTSCSLSDLWRSRVSLNLARALLFVLFLVPLHSGAYTDSGSAKLSDYEQTTFVEFPLRGEWMAPNTPGSRIPSHGTDQLGERYAFDFLQVDWSRSVKPFYRVNPLRYLVFGVPLVLLCHKLTFGAGHGIIRPWAEKVRPAHLASMTM